MKATKKDIEFSARANGGANQYLVNSKILYINHEIDLHPM